MLHVDAGRRLGLDALCAAVERHLAAAARDVDLIEVTDDTAVGVAK